MADPEIEIDYLHADSAVELWPEIVAELQRALAHDPYRSVDLAALGAQISTGYARVVVATADGSICMVSVVTMNKTNEGQRVLHVIATVGEDADLWLEPFRNMLVELARDQGATGVTMSGRPGWLKVLRGLGFKTAHVHMALPLEEVAQIGEVEKSEYSQKRKR